MVGHCAAGKTRVGSACVQEQGAVLNRLQESGVGSMMGEGGYARQRIPGCKPFCPRAGCYSTGHAGGGQRLLVLVSSLLVAAGPLADLPSWQGPIRAGTPAAAGPGAAWRPPGRRRVRRGPPSFAAAPGRSARSLQVTRQAAGAGLGEGCNQDTAAQPASGGAAKQLPSAAACLHALASTAQASPAQHGSPSVSNSSTTASLAPGPTGMPLTVMPPPPSPPSPPSGRHAPSGRTPTWSISACGGARAGQGW